MRGTGVAIAIAASAVLHASLLAVLDAVETRAIAPVKPPALLLVEAPPPPSPIDEAIPIELVMAPAAAPAAPPDPAAPAPAPTGAPAPHPRSTSTDGFIATTSTGVIGPEPTLPGEPALPGEPGVLSMRAPHRFVPLLDPSKVALTVAPPDPSRPLYHPPEPSGELHPDGGGTFRTVKPGFVGRVMPDGTVTFTDRPSAHVSLNLPRPKRIARAVQRGLEGWFEDPGAALRAGEPDPDELPFVRATENAQPGGGDRRSDPDEVIVPILSGGFDATDAVMRAGGMDPYAAAKLKWLDETRAERMEMRRRHRLLELAKSTQNMRRHLERLWSKPGLDDAGRKAALFELWDDCADTDDAALVDACARTRAAVVAFIQARLPAGSATAYTADELRAFNARRLTSAPFAPY